MESERAYIAILDATDVLSPPEDKPFPRTRVVAGWPIDEAGDRMAAAMRERFPMLDRFKSFDLARVAIASLMPTEGGEGA